MASTAPIRTPPKAPFTFDSAAGDFLEQPLLIEMFEATASTKLQRQFSFVVVVSAQGEIAMVSRYADGQPNGIVCNGFAAWVRPDQPDRLYFGSSQSAKLSFVIGANESKLDFGSVPGDMGHIKIDASPVADPRAGLEEDWLVGSVSRRADSLRAALTVRPKTREGGSPTLELFPLKGGVVIVHQSAKRIGFAQEWRLRSSRLITSMGRAAVSADSVPQGQGELVLPLMGVGPEPGKSMGITNLQALIAVILEEAVSPR